jgi:acyl carrier protein
MFCSGTAEMKKSDFIRELAEILNVPSDSLSAVSLSLRDIEAWDSVAYLATMVLLDEKVGVTVRAERIAESKTLGDLFKLADGHLAEG